MGQLEAAKPEEPVFDERAAQSETTFLAMKRSTGFAGNIRIRDALRQLLLDQSDVVKRRRCSQVAPTEIHVAVTMDRIGSRLGNHIDDQAACLPVLSVVVIR